MLITIDFETLPIVKGSPVPPRPVGLATLIGETTTDSIYYAWGHPMGNNDSMSNAEEFLKIVLEDSDNDVIMHNAKFDWSVINHYFSDIKVRATMHDTMIMAYLNDPRSESFGLKQLAQKHLGRAPDEQTDLKNWILTNVKGSTEKNWGEYIAYAPGQIVGKYAKADVEMTRDLYNLFSPVITEQRKPLL